MRALVILLACMATAHAASRSEVDCLVKVMHSEARGESLEGLVAIGQATLNRAAKQNVSICQINGVTKRKPPIGMMQYYKALAASIMASASNSIAKGADSWNTGTKPHKPGNVTRVIENHVFYVAEAK
ncbi:MAG: hypothetical protein RL563_2234 [Pseudomonadota bacterium]|jgi:hypothetical protein